MAAADHNQPAPLGGGELSQELIDKMLHGGDLSTLADPWSDQQIQAEIEAAQAAAGTPAEQAPPAGHRRLDAPAQPGSAGAAPAPTAVHPVQFLPLTPASPTTETGHGIELLLDVALEVSVELGRAHMSIGEILALRSGSVVELDKLAGEPVDVSVNGTLVARGEVVIVDEKFGVRITEVVSKARRIASLG